MPEPGGKDVPLEALRGCAAAIVVADHLTAAFFPRHFVPVDAWCWTGATNGAAAVNLFFVLSGFVLTRRALARGEAAILSRAALKRWPRLALPITLASLLSWALFALGAYRNVAAGAALHSAWLGDFGSAGGGPAHPGLWDALGAGLFTTLFRGDWRYDSALWTMAIEFRGSFLALGLALALIPLRARAPVLGWLLCAIAAAACWAVAPAYVPFIGGTILAELLADGTFRIATVPALALAAAALGVLGMQFGNEYRFNPFTPTLALPVNYHMLASMALLLAVDAAPGLGRPLSGRVAAWLGRMSFPVYLVHVLAICGPGAWAYLAVAQGAGVVGGKLAAVACALLGTYLAAWPLARFDQWWVARVGRLAGGAPARGTDSRQIVTALP